MDVDRVYVPLQGGGVRAFDRESGEPIWSSDVGTTWPLVVSGPFLFAVVPDGIMALDAATGARLWIRDLPNAVSAPLSLHADSLVATTQAGEIAAVRIADGAIAWRRSLGSVTKHQAASLGGAAVVLTLHDSRVVVVKLADGALLWERSLPGTLSAPATARDRVLVGSTNNFFYALDADSGRESWRWRTGGDVVGAAADADRIYFASLDNILRAVNRDNGNQQWKTEIPTRPSAPPIAVGDVVLTPGVAPRVDGFVGKTGVALGSYAASAELQGLPAIDPDLQPFRVAMAVFTRDGKVTALRPTRMLLPDPPLTPLLKLPGRELPPERRPTS